MPLNREASDFELLGDAGVFERASHQLAMNVEAERVVVQGRVHLLTKKEAGGPGIVGVDDGRYRYRVRLGSDEEYHDAVMAHDIELNVNYRSARQIDRGEHSDSDTN